jgi:hypothetical protein
MAALDSAEQMRALEDAKNACLGPGMLAFLPPANEQSFKKSRVPGGRA